MSDKKDDGFVSKHTDALIDSLTSLDFNNLISILCDVGIFVSWLISALVFNNFMALAFSDFDSLVLDMVRSGMSFGEMSLFFFYLFMMLLSLLLFVLLSSLLLGYSWSRLARKRFNLSLLWAFFKQNLLYGIIGLVSIYLIYNIFVDPVWQIIIFFFTLVYLWLIPIIHIRIVTRKDGKRSTNILKAFNLFRKNLHHFVVAGIITFIIMNIITLPVLLNPGASSVGMNILFSILGLAAISWAKTYFIEIMRFVEK
ncbi:MAG: hypothetical protein ACLFNK_00700 [Candidatus Woesearchaeota archaeon]